MALSRYKDRVVQYPGRIKLTNVETGEQATYDTARAEGTASEPGTPLNASRLNEVLDYVELSNATITAFRNLGVDV